MLHELDTALKDLVRRELGDGGEIEIDFDAPTKDWAARRNRPTIDIYLYDIRQDLTRSQFGRLDEHEDGRVVRRRPHPKFFRLAYLVTAWTQRAEDEHRLLSNLLVTFLRHESVPADLLTGSIQDLGVPVPIAVALPPPQDRSLSDVWSALGGELKPSLDVVLIAPLMPDRGIAAGPPVTMEPIIDVVVVGSSTRERQGGRQVPRERQSADHRPAPAAAAPAPTVGRRRRRVRLET